MKMKMLKILHITNHFYPCIGGIENYVLGLCKELRKRGYICDVATLNRSHRGLILPKFGEIEGIKIHRVPFLDLKIYKIAFKIIKFIKNYDIIHIHGVGFFSDFFLLTKFLHKKVIIVSTHGGIFHTKSFRFIKMPYFYFFQRFILFLADIIIAKSKNDYEYFSRICKPLFIPYCIDFQKFNIKKKVEKYSLLFVGRISKNKRIDLLIKSVSYLKKRIPKIKLYIIGDDWENLEKYYKNLSKKLDVENNVIFTGKKENKELLDFYSKAHVFVSASEYEGFGISVLEAMASGTPAIVNDIPAFRNFVKDGVNGFIVDFSNVNKLEKIYKILKMKNLRKLRKNSIKTSKEYDFKINIKKIVKLYENLIEGLK